MLEDPINFYYIPVFRTFFTARLKLVLSFAGSRRFNSALDIGCGSGILLPELSRRCDYIVGIDTFLQDFTLRKMMKLENFHADIAWADILALPFKDYSFDLITCISTLEHIRELETALKDMKRVLKPGGLLLAGFPARNVITDKLLGESTGFHVSGHREIFSAAEKVFGTIRTKQLPGFLPPDLSLYCAFEGSKS